MSTELAWYAGLVDGEGTFGIQRQKGRRSEIPHIQAGQVDRRVLDRFRAAVGVGKVYGPYAPRHPGHSLYCYYRATGIDATKQAHELLAPYLSQAKQELAEKALKARD